VRRSDATLPRAAAASAHDEVVVVSFVHAHLKHRADHARRGRMTREMAGYHLEGTRSGGMSHPWLGLDDCAVRGRDHDER